jgi:hypothetical protein
MRVRTLLVAVIAMIFAADLDAADKVRIGVSSYNISNLTVGVAQTRSFFKQDRGTYAAEGAGSRPSRGDKL